MYVSMMVLKILLIVAQSSKESGPKSFYDKVAINMLLFKKVSPLNFIPHSADKGASRAHAHPH